VRPRTSAGERVPWIAERDGPPIADVCARFGLTRAQLLADLEVVFLVGVHPFTPDELIDVVIEDDRVWIDLAPGAFARPLRLTPEQGLALVAAGSSLLATPGTDPGGPLARGLGKLAHLLGIDEDEAVAITLGAARREVLDVLRQGVTEHRQIDLGYYAYGRDRSTERIVEPWQLFAEGGQWYLSAWCQQAGGERLFRVDRVREAHLREATFEPPAELPPLGVYHPAPGDPRIVVDLAPSATWVLEQYQHEDAAATDDGWTRVRLAVSAVPWLERLLVRLGPAARVVAVDPPLHADLAARVAERVLARYGGEPGRPHPSEPQPEPAPG
jgi:proteasome accessory factor C